METTIIWRSVIDEADLNVGTNRDGLPIFIRMTITRSEPEGPFNWSLTGLGLSRCITCGQARYYNTSDSRWRGSEASLTIARIVALKAAQKLTPLLFVAEHG